MKLIPSCTEGSSPGSIIVTGPEIALYCCPLKNVRICELYSPPCYCARDSYIISLKKGDIVVYENVGRQWVKSSQMSHRMNVFGHGCFMTLFIAMIIIQMHRDSHLLSDCVPKYNMTTYMITSASQHEVTTDE